MKDSKNPLAYYAYYIGLGLMWAVVLVFVVLLLAGLVLSAPQR